MINQNDWDECEFNLEHVNKLLFEDFKDITDFRQSILRFGWWSRVFKIFGEEFSYVTKPEDLTLEKIEVLKIIRSRLIPIVDLDQDDQDCI